ncbi:MAG: hypothetical protein DMF40_02865, partial [Verrucomicrobia bacterium]
MNHDEAPAVAPPIALTSHDPYAAFRFANFNLYMTGNFLAFVGRQMLAVAVEWEIYRRTHSATALGLVGLVLVIPVVCLSLPAGHIADKYSRKHIIMIAQFFIAITSAVLALVSWKHLSIPAWPVLREGNGLLHAIAGVFERHQQAFHFDDFSIPVIYLLLFISGIARTFAWAARSSFFPTLVPRDVFANAVTWNSSVFQIASVVGPAISGFIVVHISFSCVYIIDAITSFLFFLLVLPIPRAPEKKKQEALNTWRSLQAGMRFVMSKHVILATITLDLFAVLLGGATALLPMFADQILRVDAIGLGWMRATPAIGAFITALVVAYLPPIK